MKRVAPERNPEMLWVGSTEEEKSNWSPIPVEYDKQIDCVYIYGKTMIPADAFIDMCKWLNEVRKVKKVRTPKKKGK